MPSNLKPQKYFNWSNQDLTAASPVRYNSREQIFAKTFLQTILPIFPDFGIQTVPNNIEITKPETPCTMDLSGVLGTFTETKF